MSQRCPQADNASLLAWDDRRRTGETGTVLAHLT